MRASGGGDEVGNGEIVGIAYADIIHLVSHEEGNGITPRVHAEDRYTAVPQPEHQGSLVPVNAEIELVVKALVTEQECQRKGFVNGVEQLSALDHLGSAENRELHGPFGIVVPESVVGRKEVIHGKAGPNPVRINKRGSGEIHIRFHFFAGLLNRSAPGSGGGQLVVPRQLEIIDAHLGVVDMHAGPDMPVIVDLDIVGILQPCIGHRQVAGTRYIAHEQDAHTTVEIFEKVIVREGVSDVCTGQRGPLVAVYCCYAVRLGGAGKGGCEVQRVGIELGKVRVLTR